MNTLWPLKRDKVGTEIEKEERLYLQDVIILSVENTEESPMKLLKLINESAVWQQGNKSNMLKPLRFSYICNEQSDSKFRKMFQLQYNKIFRHEFNKRIAKFTL